MTRWPATCPQCGAPLMGMNCPRCKFRKRVENQVVYSASEIDEGGGGTGGGAPAPGTITAGTGGGWQAVSKSTTALSFGIVTSNDDTVLVAVTYLNALGAPSSVTCDGTPMTEVSTASDVQHDVSLWLLAGVAGGAPTVTVNFASLTCVTAAAMTATGATANPTDQQNSDIGASTSPSSGAIVTTQDSELLFGAVGTNGPSGDTAGTWSNSFTAGNRTGTTGGLFDENVTISFGYRVVSTAGTYAAEKTGVTSRNWGACIVSVKAA